MVGIDIKHTRCYTTFLNYCSDTVSEEQNLRNIYLGKKLSDNYQVISSPLVLEQDFARCSRSKDSFDITTIIDQLTMHIFNCGFNDSQNHLKENLLPLMCSFVVIYCINARCKKAISSWEKYICCANEQNCIFYCMAHLTVHK